MNEIEMLRTIAAKIVVNIAADVLSKYFPVSVESAVKTQYKQLIQNNIPAEIANLILNTALEAYSNN